MCPQPAASLITHTSSTRFRPDAYEPARARLFVILKGKPKTFKLTDFLVVKVAAEIDDVGDA